MLQEPLFRERDDKYAVRRSDAHAHNGTHQGRDAECCMREEQETNDASKGGGECGDADEGIEPRLKVDNDQEEDENDRKDESAQQSEVREPHELQLAPNRDEDAGRQ